VFPPHILKPLGRQDPTATKDAAISGISPASLKFNPQAIKPLIYDEPAIASYRLFRVARKGGDIPLGTRIVVVQNPRVARADIR